MIYVDPDNTRTPLLSWGSGIRGPIPDVSPTSHDDYSKPWGLAHLYRRDVEQADIAPLMATLIGIDWPVNSVGVLPDVDSTRPGYLNVGDHAKAAAALINAKVILEQYRVKHGMFPFFITQRSNRDQNSRSGTHFFTNPTLPYLISPRPMVLHTLPALNSSSRRSDSLPPATRR